MSNNHIVNIVILVFDDAELNFRKHRTVRRQVPYDV